MSRNDRTRTHRAPAEVPGILAFGLVSLLAASTRAAADPPARGQAQAPAQADPGDPTSPTDPDAVADAVSIHETRFRVAPADVKRELPSADEPVFVPLPLGSTEHRAVGRLYMHPFLGRLVYPELSVRTSSWFARERFNNDGEPGPNRAAMALATRVDLSLWVVDLRFNFDTTVPTGSGPLELVLKAPFSVGDHHFALFTAFNIPLDVGPAKSVYEIGLGYHVHAGPFGLKAEVSGFSGTSQRTHGSGETGYLGWNGVLSWLATEAVGLVVEADGTTALLEHTSQPKPAKGDTILRLMPGLRFFPRGESGVEVGASAFLSFVPDGYSVGRRLGALFSLGYVFL